MASVITNICERIPVTLHETGLDVSEIDSTLQHFITTTAERHAGITSHKLPTVKVCPPTRDSPARVESTISVTYRRSLPDAYSHINQAASGGLQMESCSLSLALSQLIPYEPAPEIPSAFSLPMPAELPSEASIGFIQDDMRRAVQVMHWMQSHVHGKVFGARKDLSRFVDHLIKLSCAGKASKTYDNVVTVDLEGKEEPEYDEAKEISYGDELFVVRLKGDKYGIKPRPPLHEDFCRAIPIIVLPAIRASLHRVLERLDTVFLATGRFEAGWEAACACADFEVEMEAKGTVADANCVYLPEDRPHTVHRCHECLRRLLCASRYQSCQDDSTSIPFCHSCRARTIVLRCRFPSESP
jgi:hypothetical protein